MLTDKPILVLTSPKSWMPFSTVAMINVFVPIMQVSCFGFFFSFWSVFSGSIRKYVVLKWKKFVPIFPGGCWINRKCKKTFHWICFVCLHQVLQCKWASPCTSSASAQSLPYRWILPLIFIFANRGVIHALCSSQDRESKHCMLAPRWWTNFGCQILFSQMKSLLNFIWRPRPTLSFVSSRMVRYSVQWGK